MIALRNLEPIYLASPFTKYVRGHVGAYIDICKVAGEFCKKFECVVFSPISHCYGMSVPDHGALPVIDHEFWQRFNRPFIAACGGLIVAKLHGWDDSFGVRWEISSFQAAHKPILYLDPDTIELVDK